MRYSRYILLLIIPFAFMIIVNESENIIESKQCSWKCHDNTQNCKQNHTKILSPYLSKIDIPYNGIIHALSGTGNYKLANIIFLVILWPLLILFLLFKTISITKKIKSLKNG